MSLDSKHSPLSSPLRSHDADSAYRNENDRFLLQSRAFENQYSHLYFVRLQAFRSRLEQLARVRWPGVPVIEKMVDLRVHERFVVMGTVYKQMKLKPCILDEISNQKFIEPPVLMDSYVSDDDFLLLEDESGRVDLDGNIDPQPFCTGTVACFVGQVAKVGCFTVEDHAFPGLEHSIPREPVSISAYVVLLSGLNIGAPWSDSGMTELLFEYLAGFAGGCMDQTFQGSIVRVIIAGNSIAPPEIRAPHLDLRKPQNASNQSLLGSPLKEFDRLLSQLASVVGVDVMVGSGDPSNFILPQQPLHPCLLPLSSRMSSSRLTTNPHQFSVLGAKFLGTSGQNIEDICRYVRYHSRMEILRNCLEWGHIAPTAPDTLGSYPFLQEDPFLISGVPSVFFAANQSDYETDIVPVSGGETSCRLIRVPDFSRTGQICIVDIRDLSCSVMQFGSVDHL